MYNLNRFKLHINFYENTFVMNISRCFCFFLSLNSKLYGSNFIDSFYTLFNVNIPSHVYLFNVLARTQHAARILLNSACPTTVYKWLIEHAIIFI